MSLISQFDGFLSTTVHWKSLNTHTTFNYNHLLAHNFAVIKTLFYHAGSLRYTENDYQQNMWSNIKRNGYSVGSYHASEWGKGHQSQSRSDLLKVTVVLLYNICSIRCRGYYLFHRAIFAASIQERLLIKSGVY